MAHGTSGGSQSNFLLELGDAGMIKFKVCPKCKGDVSLERDQYGWYELCLQCGYLVYLRSLSRWGKNRLSRKIGGSLLGLRVGE